MSKRQDLLKALPAIDRILNDNNFRTETSGITHVLLREAAQKTVERLRQQILDSTSAVPDCDLSAVAELAAGEARRLDRPSLRQVINVTGTLLHTNLGRAPLPAAALRAIEAVARGYSNLEFDLETGQRGKRHAHVEELICRLTGAEAAHIVNNNAGAVMLALAALAQGHSALVSRGELVEIGGSFRIPDIMAASGVELVEVGTTNKTHLDDYRRAATDSTRLILKVHTSNYRILGFTQAVPGGDLAGVGRELGIPVLEDLGSGLLNDLAEFGLPPEPTVRQALQTGIDIVTFSGDKLLGGPQAGILVGKKELIDRLRRHPMARALRIDKLTLAALEATLRIYLDPTQALRDIPVLSMLSQPPDLLERRCQKLLPMLAGKTGGRAELEIIESVSTVGGGALPLAELPGYAIRLVPASISLNRLTERLRESTPPVIGRIQDDALLIDPRTLGEPEEELMIAAISAALEDGAG